MARQGLPRDLIKKYGVSKKAWSVYRSRRKRPGMSRSKTPKRQRARTARSYSNKTRRVNTMARRKRTVRRSKGFFKGTGMKAFVGGMGYSVLVEPLLDTVASKMGLTVEDDIVKAAGAFVLYSQLSGIPKEMAKAGVYISSANIAKNKLGSLKIFG